MLPLGMMVMMGRSVAAGFFMTEGGLDFFGEKDISKATVGIGMPFACLTMMVFMLAVCLLLNSAIRSSACRLSAGSHELWALL